jgi:HK97 family phage prohead protease
MATQQIPRPDREFRIHSGSLTVERRSEGDPPTIVGHAAVFDQWTTLYAGKYWTWREVVRPGAFRNALAEKQDCRALINHDSNLVLGRSKSGTLALSEDQTGLLCEINPPDTQAARDLMTLIQRGDISGMSFAFRVRANGDRATITVQGEMEQEDRELLDLDLLDVSVVTNPAYPQTDVSVRSMVERRDRPRRNPWLEAARRRLRLADAE